MCFALKPYLYKMIVVVCFRIRIGIKLRIERHALSEYLNVSMRKNQY